MARTTIAIDDDVLRRLRRLSAQRDETLQDVVNDLLRRALAAGRRERFELKLEGWQAGVQPGVELTDRDRLFDTMAGR